MTLRMHAMTAAWLKTPSSLKCHSMQCGCLNSPRQLKSKKPETPQSYLVLSTVLAQDHFFSDFLSLHLTNKTHKESMMMLVGVGSKTSPSACGCRFDEKLELAPV